MAIKPKLNADVIKKYLFWSCTPIGLAAALIAGFLAIGSIANDLEKKKSELDAQKKGMETLRGGAANHPNQGTIDAINEKVEVLKDNILVAWETMVVEQQKQNQWTGLAERALGNIANKPFLGDLEETTRDSYMLFARDEIDKLLYRDDNRLQRVEEYTVHPDGREEPRNPPRLAEGRGGMGGSRGGDMGGMSSGQSSSSSMGSRAQPIPPGSRIVLKGKVVWDRPEALVFTMNNWKDRPQSFEVWLTQEDLWVYQALLWVVAESNKEAPEQRKQVVLGATGAGMGSSGMSSSSMGMSSVPGSRVGGDPLDLRGSVVKQIIDITIGMSAAVELEKKSGSRIRASGGMGSMGSMGSSGGMGSMGSGSMGSGSMGSMGSSGGMGSMGSGSMGSGSMGSMGSSGGMGRSSLSPEAAKTQAMRGRYVDATGKPLINVDLTGPFRRMPVYLSLLVDQLYIPEILVNCANCPMPIDVLWVTINPSATQGFEFASGPSSGGGLGMGGGSSVRGGSGGSSRGSLSSSSEDGSSGYGGGTTRSGGSVGRSAVGNVEFGPNAVRIDIYGCINIFTPPDPEKISGTSAPPGTNLTSPRK